jgi:hypothetical protein
LFPFISYEMCLYLFGDVVEEAVHPPCTHKSALSMGYGHNTCLMQDPRDEPHKASSSTLGTSSLEKTRKSSGPRQLAHER